MRVELRTLVRRESRTGSGWVWGWYKRRALVLCLCHCRADFATDNANLTRIETRTKESNNHASIWVANPGAQRKRRPPADWRRGGVSVGEFLATDQEHACWDPKGGELCPTRAKSEETLMEARSRSDVQIDGQSWV